MSSPDNTTIKDQILKLLAMTPANGCTQEEAASAAAMAQRLLTKYKLDMREIEQLAASKGDDFINVQFQHAKHTVDATWCRSLIVVVADAFYCDYLYTSGDTTRGWIIGKKQDIELVEYIHAYLYRTIARLIRERWHAEHLSRVERYGTPDPYQLMTPFKWRRSYALGAVSAIGETVKRMRHQEQVENNNCMALVLVNKDALVAAKHRMFSKIKPGKKIKREKDYDAYSQGYTDGRDISITPAIKPAEPILALR